LITCARGFGFTRIGRDRTSSPPAAGKVETTGIGGFFLGVVVVVGAVVVTVVPVVVVPVAPASARVGRRTAAANPARARSAEARKTLRLTR
jgi:hypothetical protein